MKAPGAVHELSCCQGPTLAACGTWHQGDGAVSNEAIVKLFTSCRVKRDHSVVEMKVFEIFIPVYMVLEWKSSGKQTKRPQTSSPEASWLMYGDGGWQGHGRG